MDMYQNPYMAFPGITPEEMAFLQQGSADLNDNQKKYFYMIYSGKRKNPQDMLLFCLLGLFLVPAFYRWAGWDGDFVPFYYRPVLRWLDYRFSKP
jgi:hypothetical protein